MSKPNSIIRSFFRSSLLWGGLATVGFYSLLDIGVIRGEVIRQLFAEHPIEYVATTMFFIALAALAIKLFDVSDQRKMVREPLLESIPCGGQPVSDCEDLIEQIDQKPKSRQSDYLILRLRDALDFVRRSDSSEGVVDQLRFLSDMDAGRAHSSYGLIRVIIWAIPILGFLGTVIGIAMAIGNMSLDAPETSLPIVMNALGVAFSTTIQALGLSIVLMFALYYTEQKENLLLADVDHRSELEMVGRFERTDDGGSDQLTAVRRMIEAVVQSNDDLLKQQTKLWWSTVETANQRWSKMADDSARQLKKGLAVALSENLTTHADALTAAENDAAEQNRLHWNQTLNRLVKSVDEVVALKRAVIEKAEVLNRAVHGTEQVQRLESTLNDNLEALAGSKNFEETVMSLAAAIHLLNARLEQTPAEKFTLKLNPRSQTGKTGKAA